MELIVLVLFFLFFGNLFSITHDPTIIFLSLIVITLGLLISFTFKMIIGLTAFWLTDIGGFYQLIEALIILFAGFTIPITLLPSPFAQIAHILPFSYMVYFPIASIQGTLSIHEIIKIIVIQGAWLILLGCIYHIIWRSGIKKFSGVGQ